MDDGWKTENSRSFVVGHQSARIEIEAILSALYYSIHHTTPPPVVHFTPLVPGEPSSRPHCKFRGLLLRDCAPSWLRSRCRTDWFRRRMLRTFWRSRYGTSWFCVRLTWGGSGLRQLRSCGFGTNCWLGKLLLGSNGRSHGLSKGRRRDFLRPGGRHLQRSSTCYQILLLVCPSCLFASSQLRRFYSRRYHLLPR